MKNTDFEVFQALDIDSENSSSANQGILIVDTRKTNCIHSSIILVRLHLLVSDVVSATSDYTQDIPPLQRPWERMTGPPILPPHLLQIILNKDTPLSVSFVPI